jgi:uncharacterized membrane protein (UPF0136 family)
MTTAQIVVWVYIVLLVAGGLVGFLKAGSKASIVASSIFAAVLALFALNVIPFSYVWIILLVLVLFFAKRFWSGRKFMPGGMMLILTIVTLVLVFLLGA